MTEIPFRNLIKNTSNYSWDLEKKYEQNNCNFNGKPSGIWYEIKDKGLIWSFYNDYGWGNHIYDLQLSDDINILHIKTNEDLQNLNEKYNKKICDGMSVIDWTKISEQYDGIEFNNYNEVKNNVMNEISLNFIWFFGIDFDSGCIWNLKKIKKISYWDKYEIKD